MALHNAPETEPPFARPALWRKILAKANLPRSSALAQLSGIHTSPPVESGPPAAPTQAPRKVVTGLPRAQTFKRQQSEQRMHLAPVTPSADERRACSVDRRASSLNRQQASRPSADPRASAPVVLGFPHADAESQSVPSIPASQPSDDLDDQSLGRMSSHPSSIGETIPALAPDDSAESQSMTTSQHEAMINDELEKTWILNLSMHFRDRSKREKFFVTYRESDQLWRRVTVSLDYRFAPPNSLEMDLMNTRFQREKSARIYEAIRESLPDIKFYDTVTNLKLETTDGRLHVHVVEDGNEIINYPRVSQVRHLGCRRIRERDIVFDSHMSGFVYKVCVRGHGLIKKEIPSQDTVDEFLYEVNALNSLRFSRDVVDFYGVVIDDSDEHIKGLLISYASQGALIDIIYEHCKENSRSLPWGSKTKWARQIIQGLADIHESGFVQGDFTLSNIVIDGAGDAKIIDINRRGCPVGWEPPETTALLDAGHRITMYIGVKSDLYQLGMVLWGLAVDEDEPETHGRPLVLGSDVYVPEWYRRMTEICLSADPRKRLQASSLLQFFPHDATDDGGAYAKAADISVDDGHSLSQYYVDGYRAGGRPLVRTLDPASDWPYSCRTYVDTSPVPYELYYPSRGRSPPSPGPSDVDPRGLSRDPLSKTSWAANRSVRPSYTDEETMSDSTSNDDNSRQTPATNTGAARVRAGRGVLGATISRLPETCDVTPNPLAIVQDGEAAATPRVSAMPRLAREQTAFIAKSPWPRSNPEAAGVLSPAIEGRQWTADSCTAESVRGHISREVGATSRFTEEAAGDVSYVTQERSCDDRGALRDGARSASRKPKRQLSAAEGEDGAAGPEREPEYVAAQGRRSADMGVEPHYDDGRGDGPWTIDCAVPRTGNTAYAAASQNSCGFSGGLASRDEEAPQTDGDRRQRTALPVSLTGVGAAHMGIDDEVMRGKGILDDDLGAGMQTPTLPALFMTMGSSP